MRITEKWLKEKSACSDGIQWFLAQKETDCKAVLEALIKDDKLHWANWLICRLMDKPSSVRYAIFAALEVIHLFEKKYPKDKRPRKAIEAARAWLANPNKQTKAAADADADAAYAAADDVAYAAADDAYAAADVAYAAADDTAYADAAANVAYAAADVAYAAADDTAYAAYAAAAYADAANYAANYAAQKELQLKIFKYGMTLLRSDE